MLRKVFVFILLSAGTALGQGSVVQVQYPVVNNTYRYDLQWTSDSSGDVVFTVHIISGIIRQVEFVPDGTAVPDDEYDVELLSSDSVDVLGGLGIDQSDTSALVGYIANPYYYDGREPLTLSVTNSGSETAGIFRFYMAPGGTGGSLPLTVDTLFVPSDIKMLLGDLGASAIYQRASDDALVLDTDGDSVNIVGDLEVDQNLNAVSGTYSLTLISETTFLAQGLIVATPQAVGCANNSVALVPAAITLVPTASYIEVTNLDPDGCTITLDEAGAVAGEQFEITILSTPGVSEVLILELPGVVDLAGVGDVTLTANNVIGFRYASTLNIFLERYRSIN